MKKVICINDKPIQKMTGCWSNPTGLKEGETYTVTKEFFDAGGYLSYCLLEAKCDGNIWGGYKAYRFVPLSSIDETEFVRDYNKQEA